MEKWLFLLSSWNISDWVNDLLVTQKLCFVVISLACWRMKSIPYAGSSRLARAFLEASSYRRAPVCIHESCSLFESERPGIQGDLPMEDQWCQCGIQIGSRLWGSNASAQLFLFVLGGQIGLVCLLLRKYSAPNSYIAMGNCKNCTFI